MRLRKRRCFILSLVLIGGITLSVNHFHKEEKIEEVYLEEINAKIENNSYLAVLDIPTINLKKELFPKDNPDNDVNKNLFITSSSIFPNDNSNSNIIIAGHSGNSNNAFFKDLYKLNLNSEVKLYYNNKTYTYLVKEIEYQAKTGTLYLKNNYHDMLTLITCTKNNDKTQTIYYAELKNM
ncbi:MAG: sortase [Ruminococcus sp.]|nr:sortase [Ruminococcus sp.]